MLSVYRKGRARAELDHLACIGMAARMEDIDLVTWVLGSGRAALVGLGEHTSIIKPKADGDEKVSFDDLFDTALSLREYRRLQNHGVSDTGELKDVLYKTTLVARLTSLPEATVLIRARDERDFERKLRELVFRNEEFQQALTHAIIEDLLTSGKASYTTGGALILNDPAPDSAPPWEFTTHPE